MTKFIKTFADKIVRNPRDRAGRPLAELAGRRYDAVAYAAALEILG
jgi:hypothetical protein